ncbi:hypothetical protein [Sphingomonas yabuuchiae]
MANGRLFEHAHHRASATGNQYLANVEAQVMEVVRGHFGLNSSTSWTRKS